MRVAIFTYTGDGTLSRSLTGIGFEPHLVLVRGGSNQSAFMTRTMMTDGSETLSLGGISSTTAILSLDADGFTVNNNARVNQSGADYYGFAIAPNGMSDFWEGKHTGTGSSGLTVTTGIPQNVVFVKRTAASNAGVMKVSTHPGNESAILAASANAGSGIQTFTATGFTLGTLANVNTLGATYYDFAFIAPYVFSYTGNGADDRTIAIGGEPDWSLIKSETTQQPYLRSDDMPDDFSLPMNNAAGAANFIQRFNASGVEVGSEAAVNAAATAFYGFGLTRVAGAAGIARVIGLSGITRLINSGMVN